VKNNNCGTLIRLATATGNFCKNARKLGLKYKSKVTLTLLTSLSPCQSCFIVDYQQHFSDAKIAWWMISNLLAGRRNGLLVNIANHSPCDIRVKKALRLIGLIEKTCRKHV